MKKIAIDAGHGLYTSGKRCYKEFDTNETREWTINNAVANKVMKLLENYECETLRTDNVTGEVDITLATRCNKANDFGADVFVSIHHNAASGDTATGVEVYCCRTPKDATENLRDMMYEEIIKSNCNTGNRSDGTREMDFFVLTRTNMPAALIENGFMTSKVDVDLILSEEYQIKSAEGIVNALVKYLYLEEKTVEKVVETVVESQNVANVVTNEKKEEVSTVNITLTVLKNGMISNEVKTLQRLLNCLIGSGLSVDGNFGAKTLVAVKKFQTSKGLTVDGCVGTNTWNKLLR